MELTDWLTLGIAVWGAGLSTLLGVRELQKETRRIKVFLDTNEWMEDERIVITNIGHRPITITNLRLIFSKTNRNPAINRPKLSENVFSFDSKWFPQTIKDGEQIVVPMMVDVGDGIKEENTVVKVLVYDAEGNCYKKFHLRKYNKYNDTFVES